MTGEPPAEPPTADTIPWEAVGALSVGLFGMGAAIGSYSGYVPLLLDRGVSPSMAGLGMTIFLLCLFLSVLPSDWLTHVHSTSGVTVVGLAIGGVGALLAGVPTLPTALLSRGLLGVGQGAVFVTSMKYVGVRSPRDVTASTQGILGGVFTFGFAVALASTPVFLARYGPTIPAITATFMLIGGVWTARLPVADTPALSSFRDYGTVFVTASGVALGLANMATFGFLMVATTWYTELLNGFSTLPVTAVLTGFALATVVGRVCGGWVEEELGPRITVSISLVGLTLALCVLLVAIYLDLPWLLGLAIVTTGLGFGVPFGPLFGFAFTELTAEPGTVLVGMMIVGNAGAMIYPWLIGSLLASTTSYLGGFGAMALSVIAVLCIWQVTIPHRT